MNAVLHYLGFSDAHNLPVPSSDTPNHAAELRPGIVHRLDAGTTGLIAVAKTDAWKKGETVWEKGLKRGRKAWKSDRKGRNVANFGLLTFLDYVDGL